MEDLRKKYNEECSLRSKLVNRLLKIGYILIVSIFIWGNINKNNYFINVIMFFIFSIILYMSCNIIMLKKISKKLNSKFAFKELVFKRKSRIKIYQELDKFQKNWITNYCKKNKINSIEKLKILRDELGRSNNIIKYINPAIVGTLIVAIWGLVAEEMYKKIGIFYTSFICIIGAFLVSIIIGVILEKNGKNK